MSMRKRVQTTIEESALKALDIKIINSDFFKDRSSYLELLIQFIPYIPNDVKPDEDITEIMRKMCVNSGVVISAIEPNQIEQEIVDADREILKMAKKFRHKNSTKGE